MVERPAQHLPAQEGGGELGRSLSHYELLGEIASGGMATVHLARLRGAEGFERLVALKRCHPHLRKDPTFRDMLLDEARLAAKIRHPHVVATLDALPGESLSLVMEYVQGGSLTELLAWTRERHAFLPLGVVLRIVMDALLGLGAAHALRDESGRSCALVHRDVSPQNILVGVDGSSRLADFGVAKADERLTVTRDGHLKGKVPYMSPEVLQGGPITPALDLYAAGVVLWEALTSERLFRADSEGAVLDLVLRNVVPPPSSRRKDVPPELDALVKVALHRDPSRRFASSAAFVEALEKVGVPVASPLTVGELAGRAFAERVQEHRRMCVEARPRTRAPRRWRLGRAAATVGLTLVSGVMGAVAFRTWAPTAGRTEPTRAVAPASAPLVAAPPPPPAKTPAPGAVAAASPSAPPPALSRPAAASSALRPVHPKPHRMASAHAAHRAAPHPPAATAAAVPAPPKPASPYDPDAI